MNIICKLLHEISIRWVTPLDTNYLATGKITGHFLDINKKQKSSSEMYEVKSSINVMVDGKIVGTPRENVVKTTYNDANKAYNHGLKFLQENNCPEKLFYEFIESWETTVGN